MYVFVNGKIVMSVEIVVKDNIKYAILGNKIPKKHHSNILVNCIDMEYLPTLSKNRGNFVELGRYPYLKIDLNEKDLR